MKGQNLKPEEKEVFRQDNISFRGLRTQYAKEACQVVAEALNQENLFSKGIASLSPEIEKQVIKGNQSYMGDNIEECCRNRLSMVAVDVETGQVAGAFLVKDATYSSEEAEEPNYFGKVIISIVMKLLEATESPMKAAFGQKGQVAEVMAIGVSKKYSNRKIGSKLVELVNKSIKDKGFKYAYTLAIDARSLHLGKKTGGESIAQLKNHRQFEYDGEKPLRNVDESVPIELMCFVMNC